MRIYVKLFVGIALPCAAGIMALLAVASVLLHSSTPWMTWAALGAALGAGFGAIMSVGLGTAHRACVRQLPYAAAPDAFDVRHVRALVVDLPYEEAFDACVASIRALGRWRIHRDWSEGTIEATTTDRERSGDLARFTIEPVGSARARVRVTTRPAVRAAMVDYGTNLENVERIVAHLESLPRWTGHYR